MAKVYLTDEEKAFLIEAINKGTEAQPDLLPKLFPAMAEKFDVQAVGDKKAIKEAEEERKKRNKKGMPEVDEDAVLPVVKGGLVRRKKAMFDF